MKSAPHALSTILTSLGSQPRLRKAVKVIALLSLAVILVIGALLAWAGVVLFNSAERVVKNADVTAPLAEAQRAIENLPAATAFGCWDHAKTLLNIEPWLETPLNENLRQLKQACVLERSPS